MFSDYYEDAYTDSYGQLMSSINIVQAVDSGTFGNSLTLGSGLTLNNYLIMVGWEYNAGGSAILPSNPTVNGASIPSTTILSGSAPTTSNVSYAIWLTQVNSAMAGQTAVAYSYGASSGSLRLTAIEVSGGTLTLDQTAQGSGVGTGVNATAGPTPATSASGELAICAFGMLNSGVSVTTGGWTVVGTQQWAMAGYQILNSAGSTPSVTSSVPSTVAWAGAVVTLSLPASSGSSVSLPLITRWPF